MGGDLNARIREKECTGMKGFEEVAGETVSEEGKVKRRALDIKSREMYHLIIVQI